MSLVDESGELWSRVQEAEDRESWSLWGQGVGGALACSLQERSNGGGGGRGGKVVGCRLLRVITWLVEIHIQNT